MWRRVYLALVLVRLYFALRPSYLHPDENFQGPEVIAGQIFSYPVRLTWEFTSNDPVRSVFPLWPVYGLPMLLLRWLWIGTGEDGEIPPMVVFWALRVLMFVLSFVLEDWALHELIQSPRHRKVAVMLVASSYVTWTYQTHTFSNSIETLAVAWSLVLIQRIVESKRSTLFASAILAFVVVFGVFNRVTFPAFLIIPGLRLIPYFMKKPFSLLSGICAALFASFIAIYLDTRFYTDHKVTWSYLYHHPTITPLNLLRYNMQTSNLAKHGLHPWYQHILFNIPQLLGPAALLLFFRPHLSLRLYSAISGVFVLSIPQHQEARFLLPTIPLILSSVQLPKDRVHLRIWTGIWVVFNIFFGILMGLYHQGGVIPGQKFLSQQPDATNAVWWKTYTPPIWLLNGKNEVLKTHDIMGMEGNTMLRELSALATCHKTFANETAYLSEKEGTYLLAPLSATFLDKHVQSTTSTLHFEEVWRHRKHLNLDDLDFGDDGFWNTIRRVVGRRGLGAWRVTKDCGKG